MLDTTSELRFIFNFLNNKKDTLFSAFKNGATLPNKTIKYCFMRGLSAAGKAD